MKTRKLSEIQFTSEPGEPLVLKLFVAGNTPNSVRAITNLKRICDHYLSDNYELEIVDVYKNPEFVKQEELIALPALIKKAPEPIKYIVGNLSDEKRVLQAIGISYTGSSNGH